MINNRLISRNIPPKVLSEKEFKKLLHIWAVLNTNFGNTFNGYNNFSKTVPCTRLEYRNIMARLEEMHFIEVVPKSSKISFIYGKMMPLYNSIKDEFVVTNPCTLTGNAYKLFKEHFTVVPTSALIKSLKLPMQDIKVLLKLYKYNNYELFGAIDPNVICIENDGQWYIHPRIVYDLYVDDNELFSTIENLINEGFIVITDTELTIEEYDFEQRLMIGKNIPTEKMRILTPKYQYIGVEEDEL